MTRAPGPSGEQFVPSRARIARAQMTAFMRDVESATGRSFASAHELHDWAVAEPDLFWARFLAWSALPVEGSRTPVRTGTSVESTVFFPGVRLNVAECCLAPGASDAAAVIARAENGSRRVVSRRELRARVARLAAALDARGVTPSSRVAALAGNDADTVALCLAVTGLGATWSSVSPDMGPATVVGRFAPLAPDVLITRRDYAYQGVARESVVNEALRETLAPKLVVALDEPSAAIWRDATDVVSLDALEQESRASGWEWQRRPFNHPLFILFSSGTTGPPKCIVHGAGGTLLEHAKEHRLHTDLTDGDLLYFQTSTGWMMWNWQLTALASGAAIVTYDGSPTYPEADAVWRLVEEEGVTVLGTSPTYLQYCRDAAIEPADHELRALRLVQSTGSVLARELYDWVDAHVKHVPLDSISGGTDVIGCFVMGSPTLPVRPGASAMVSLGLDVRAVDGEGREVEPGQPGELVCVSPFPSRPLRFHGDPDGRRFHSAYFAQNPGMWTHGDTVRFTPHRGVEVLGRSDGVLNIRGVRIGPAEITEIVRGFGEIEDALAVDQAHAQSPGGARLLLFVIMRDGAVLDRPLVLRIKRALKTSASANHVPAVISAVPAFPRTFSGKVSLRAVRDAVNGRPVANHPALANPEVLDGFVAASA